MRRGGGTVGVGVGRTPARGLGLCALRFRPPPSVSAFLHVSSRITLFNLRFQKKTLFNLTVKHCFSYQPSRSVFFYGKVKISTWKDWPGVAAGF
jgi:hypothetical protein